MVTPQTTVLRVNHMMSSDAYPRLRCLSSPRAWYVSFGTSWPYFVATAMAALAPAADCADADSPPEDVIAGAAARGVRRSRRASDYDEVPTVDKLLCIGNHVVPLADEFGDQVRKPQHCTITHIPHTFPRRTM